MAEASETFTKRPAEPQAALAEAAYLNWLREASTAVAEVVSADEEQITTVRVSSTRPTLDAARQAGRELAKIHLAGAEAFGSPPPGWEGLNYIGTQTQDCIPTDDWADFYVGQRVLPFAEKAARRGNLSAEGLEVVQEAGEIIRARDWDVTPARLHGDLWTGNLMFGSQGPVMIDPAAHGGHPETDLAMLALFGAPHLDEIRAGYEEVNPLRDGWLAHTPIHQLHPLAVHAASHGPSYGHTLVDAARSTVQLLG